MLGTVDTTGRMTAGVTLFVPYDPFNEVMRWERLPDGRLVVTISPEMEEAAKGFWELVQLYCPPGARLEVGDMNEPPP